MGQPLPDKAGRYKKSDTACDSIGLVCGVPKGIRTPVPTVKGLCPRPLDDGDLILVEVSGIEPLTSCMPCKRSPS